MVRSIFSLVLAVCAIITSDAALAQLYRWTDAEGRVHYSNVAAPAGAKPVEMRLGEVGGPAVPAQIAQSSAAKSSPATPRPAAAPAPRVVMYATSWCPYCEKARVLFRSQGVTFTEHDIEKSAEARAEHKRLGGRGVPLIVVGDKTLKGFNEQKIRAALAGS
jgi:glutaredoxin-like YruB-family protein